MAIITIFLGSVRRERQGDKVGKWIKLKLEERGHTVHYIDPVDHPDVQVLTDQFKTKEHPSDDFKQLQTWVQESDAFICITPEYNHGYSGALKNMLDCFLEEYFFKPFGIVSYSAGSFGGVRAAEQLRGVISEFCVSTPIVFTISNMGSTFGADGSLQDEAYNKRFDKFVREFEWFVEALKHQRIKGTPY